MRSAMDPLFEHSFHNFNEEVADRQGFEPWRRSPAYTLSRRAPSTTRPPVRGVGDTLGTGERASEKTT